MGVRLPTLDQIDRLGSDFGLILTADEAAALDAKFAKYRALANQPGDVAGGNQVATLCRSCHLINGQGGNIGPNISGAGAMGQEALLRRLITPNASMESAYHIFRVNLRDGGIREGFLVRDDKDAAATITYRDPTLFAMTMETVSECYGQRVAENPTRFNKRNPMFAPVDLRLGRIPFEMAFI